METKIDTSAVASFFAWLAAFWSYAVNHSILWAIFHFLFGPAYIAYRVVFKTSLLFVDPAIFTQFWK